MRRAATYCPSSGAFNSAKLQFPAVPTHYLRPWRRSKKKHDTTCPVNYSGRSKNTYLTEKKVRNDLAKKKMDSDMQKLPLMSHGGPGHVPRAGLYWYNLLAGRSAGWLASGLCTPASLAYRRCTSFGIEIWTINHVLSSFACLLAYLCAGCLVYSSLLSP